MPDALTERQNEAYEFIVAYNRDRRTMPTLREIGTALGIASSNATTKLVDALVKKGYLTRTPHAARSLRLTDASALGGGAADTVPFLPLVGRLSSATPAPKRRPEGFFAFDAQWLPRLADPDDCLFVRAGDDGMNGEGIRKGDLVAVHACDDAALRSGDLAAFVVGETVQIRSFERGNGRWHLRTANRGYSDETYFPNSPACALVGKAVAVVRRLS